MQILNGGELLTSSCVFPRKLMVRSSRSIVAHPPVRDIVYVAVERQVERVAVRAGSVVQRELGFGEHDRSGWADELAVLVNRIPKDVSTELVCCRRKTVSRRCLRINRGKVPVQLWSSLPLLGCALCSFAPRRSLDSTRSMTDRPRLDPPAVVAPCPTLGERPTERDVGDQREQDAPCKLRKRRRLALLGCYWRRCLAA